MSEMTYKDIWQHKTLEDLDRMGLCFQERHPGPLKDCGFPDCDCWEVAIARKNTEKQKSA